MWHPLFYCRADLLESNDWLRFKLDFLWNPGLLSAPPVVRLLVRQIQTPGNGQTRLIRTHRETHRYPAILLFTHLPTVLPHHAYRMRPFLGKPVSSTIHACTGPLWRMAVNA